MLLHERCPQPLQPASMLEVWESGASATNPQRALQLIGLAYPEENSSSIRRLPLGEWNLALLKLRQACFGDEFALVDKCQACGESVEFNIQADQLLDQATPPCPDSSRRIHFETWTVEHRPLWGGDLLESPSSLESESAGRALIARTILSVNLQGTPAASDIIPSELWERLASSITEYDPACEIIFNLTCPKCSEHWESHFEPAEYLYLECAARARALLYQSHLLASAYGWTEEAIFKLSDERRAAYLAFIDEQNSGGMSATRFDTLSRNTL